MRALAIFILGFLAGSCFEHASHSEVLGNQADFYGFGWKMFAAIGAYQVARATFLKSHTGPSPDKPRPTGNN